MKFFSNAWLKLFRIREPLIHEYVREFLATDKFRDPITDLNTNGTLTFQLGGGEKIYDNEGVYLGHGDIH